MTDIEKIIKKLESYHDRLLKAAEQDTKALLEASIVADAIALFEAVKRVD